MGIQNKIVEVPINFRFPDQFSYPVDNNPDFEYWLSTVIKDEDISGERMYLPITWTAYYKIWQYGENKIAIDNLQKFLNALDLTKKYWTVIQWDLGCLNELSHLDIKVFSMAGKPMDYPLPLISQPHPFTYTNEERKIKCCFVGANTHPVRAEIFNLAYQHPDYFISANKYPLQAYCSVLAHSVFSLCPRGVSGNSFRVQESLQYQSIPIVISNEFNFPHDIAFDDYGICLPLESVNSISEIIQSFTSEDVIRLRENGKAAYRELYTFEANKNLILKKVNSNW